MQFVVSIELTHNMTCHMSTFGSSSQEQGVINNKERIRYYIGLHSET